MIAAADTFGSYGSAGQLGIPLRAARATDRLVTGVIALVLALIVAFSGYALWDEFRVLNADSGLQKPTSAESFAALLAINPDVVAWLTVDNTGIDYPVVQGKDDFEYLSTDPTGEYAASGSIFLMSECDRSFHEPYEVLMGHHMQYGKMFGDLDKFLDQQFFEQNGSAELLLPDRTLSLEAVAVLTADAYDNAIFGVPVTESGMPGLVDAISERATYQREGSFSADDQLIALSTCASSGANARTVLVCKVTGEQPGVAAS